MSIVRTEPTGFTLREIADACTADARIGRRSIVSRHADAVIETCDAVVLNRASATDDPWSRDRIRRLVASEYRSVIGPILWLFIRGAINWIIMWYLDLIFTRPTFAPWSSTRKGHSRD